MLCRNATLLYVPKDLHFASDHRTFELRNQRNTLNLNYFVATKHLRTRLGIFGTQSNQSLADRRAYSLFYPFVEIFNQRRRGVQWPTPQRVGASLTRRKRRSRLDVPPFIKSLNGVNRARRIKSLARRAQTTVIVTLTGRFAPLIGSATPPRLPGLFDHLICRTALMSLAY